MWRKASFLFVLAIVSVLALPAGVAAQEEEDEEEPLVVRLSFFMCDLGGGAGDAIEEEIEAREIPAWEAIVQEGRGIQDYGYIFHWWADEWNVGIYTIGESIQAIVDAAADVGDRLEEQYGDAPTAFSEACPHHKDGFYTMGPGTGMAEEENPPGGN